MEQPWFAAMLDLEEDDFRGGWLYNIVYIITADVPPQFFVESNPSIAQTSRLGDAPNHKRAMRILGITVNPWKIVLSNSGWLQF